MRILLVEDCDDDAFLVSRELRELGPHVVVERVDSQPRLLQALAGEPWDLVVSDFNLPRFDGIAALRCVKQLDADLPFILVSAVVGEEIAVEAMRAGASDYVMKGNLARLGPAVERELRDAAMRRGKKAAEARLEHMASHDPITGLANRALFAERLTFWTSAASPSEGRLGLILIEIDRFKSLDSSLGSLALDGVLREMGARLSRCSAIPEHVARIGDDRFAVMLPGQSEEDEAELAVKWCLERTFGAPFHVDGVPVAVHTHAGVAIHSKAGGGAESLMRHAEAALGRAKAQAEPFVFHRAEMSARIAERLTLESRLRRALANREFVVHYQPQVSLEDGRIRGVEALLRWRSPDLGLVLPGSFMPVLEDTDLILDVGAWVLEQAASHRRGWQEAGLAPPRVAVNISMRQIRRRDFVAVVTRAIAGGCWPPGIDLEVTEGMVMEDMDDCVEKLTALRELGLRIVLDDFGTGYSSLGYLARLPVQVLKVDRSFVAGMVREPHLHALVTMIVDTARSLGLEVIAEGIETHEQLRALHEIGCDQVQGYLIGRPAGHEETTRLLVARGVSSEVCAIC